MVGSWLVSNCDIWRPGARWGWGPSQVPAEPGNNWWEPGHTPPGPTWHIYRRGRRQGLVQGVWVGGRGWQPRSYGGGTYQSRGHQGARGWPIESGPKVVTNPWLVSVPLNEVGELWFRTRLWIAEDKLILAKIQIYVTQNERFYVIVWIWELYIYFP